MFDEHEISFNGNVATVSSINIGDLNLFVGFHDLEQFSAKRGTGDKIDTWVISFPMTEEHREMYAPLIHRHNNEQKKLAKKNSKGNNDSPPKGPTPPSGGSPAAGKVLEFKTVEAIAA